MATVKVEITRNFVEVRELGDSFTVGRAEDADLILLHPSVSRRHARIFQQDGAFHVEDLGAANGVVINGNKVKTQQLVEGDSIQVGIHRLFFSFEDLGEAANKIDFFDVNEESSAKLEADVIASDDVLIRFSSDEPSVEAVQAALNAKFEPLGFDDLQRINLETAVNEAVGNAVRHGHKYDASKTVEVRLLTDADKMVLRVLDEGPGFDFKKALAKGMELDAVDAARARAAEGGMGGLGILMMLRCVDAVEYNESGNQLTLTKYRSDEARERNQPAPNPGAEDGKIVGT